MRFLLQLRFIKQLYQYHLLLPTVVGVVVIGVLLHGIFSRKSPAPVISESMLQLPVPPNLPILRPNLEKTPLTYRSDYYLQLGEQAKTKLVLVGEESLPGLVVSPGMIVTSARAASEARHLRIEQEALQALTPENKVESIPESPTESESAMDEDTSSDLLTTTIRSLPPETSVQRVSLVSSAAELSLAVLKMEQPYIATPFSPINPAMLNPGSPLVAISVLANGRLNITPGYLTSSGNVGSSTDAEPLHISITFPTPLVATAIVDLDGRLVGAAFRSGDRTHLLSSNELLKIVDGLRAGSPCRAIEASDLSEDVRSAFRLKGGVLIERVHSEAFTPRPSIRPADILLQWDGQDISAAEQFYTAYEKQRPGTLVSYSVVRNRRKLSGATVVPGPDCRPVDRSIRGLPAIGLTLQWNKEASSKQVDKLHQGWRVLRVVKGSLASDSGVRTGDLIIGINGRAITEVNEAQYARRLAADTIPRVLTVYRGDHIQLIALTAGDK